MGRACRPAPVLRLSGLSETAKTWREGNALAQTSAKKTARTNPRSARLHFHPQRGGERHVHVHDSGERTQGRQECVAQTKHNHRKHGCTRTVTAGTLTFSGYARANKVRFDGVLANHHKLKPGNYTLLVTATLSGKRSTTSTLHFTIAG